MKSSIIIVTILGLLTAGCSTTTYLSLTENNKEQIEQKLSDYNCDEDVGAEITLSKNNGTEINGELLFVRDTSIIICPDIALFETELARINHPIYNIRNSEIIEITIEGGWYIWSRMGYGALGGALLGAGLAAATYEKSSYMSETGAIIIVGVLGTLVGAITGGVVGYTLSSEEFILQEIPPGYDFSFLKSFARYRDEEPEYLKAIK